MLPNITIAAESVRTRWSGRRRALLGVAVFVAAFGCAAFVSFARDLYALMNDPGEDQAVAIIELMHAGSFVREKSQNGACPSPVAMQAVLSQIGADPWGHDYRYEVSPRHAFVARLFSLGRDARVGGRGADSDVVIWIDAAHGLRSSYSLEQPPFGLIW